MNAVIWNPENFWEYFEKIPDNLHKKNIEIQLLKLKIENYLKKKWLKFSEFIQTVPNNLRENIENAFNNEDTFSQRFDSFKEKSPDFIWSITESTQTFKNKMSAIFEKINVKEIWWKVMDWVKFIATLPLKIIKKYPKTIAVSALLIILTWWIYWALEFAKTWSLIWVSAIADQISMLLGIDATALNWMVPEIVELLSSWPEWIPAV